jgi:hypothetical protein
MSIATIIANSVSSALAVIKQFTAQPKINGMPIKTTRFDCIMEAEVSRHVLINLQQNLENVMDNVAPGPRTWEIEGYIGGLPIELTSLYMPSLKFFVDLLDTAFFSRQTVNLIDPDFRSFSVLISRFNYSGDPQVLNRVPVKISLVEVNVLKADVGQLASVPGLQANASPVPGQPFAAPAALGSTPNLASVGAPTGLVSGVTLP